MTAAKVPHKNPRAHQQNTACAHSEDIWTSPKTRPDLHDSDHGHYRPYHYGCDLVPLHAHTFPSSPQKQAPSCQQ